MASLRRSSGGESSQVHPSGVSSSPCDSFSLQESDSPLVEEVPLEVENQVLESSALLSASPSGQEFSPGDVEANLPTCPIEDPPIEEGSELEDSDDEVDSISLDGSIARELEDLMSKLSKASSVEYRLSSSNRVMSDFPDHPSYLMYEDLPDFEPEIVQQH